MASLLQIQYPILLARRYDGSQATGRIKEQLLRHEDLRLKPYRCTADKLTIGVGRNLDDCGITQKEAYVLVEGDILQCERQILAEIPKIYLQIDEVRKTVEI